MDPKLQAIKQVLSESGFVVETVQPPDEKHFGNWILSAVRDSLVVRVTSDKGGILLDLMPGHLFREGATESDWYNWDVVVRALELKTKSSEDDLMSFLQESGELKYAFAPLRWKDTLGKLRQVEEDKRRRFMKERTVRA